MTAVFFRPPRGRCPQKGWILPWGALRVCNRAGMSLLPLLLALTLPLLAAGQAAPAVIRAADVLCGPLCLLAACESLGVRTSLPALLDLCGPPRDGHTGMSLAELQRAAEALGLETCLIKATLQELHSQGGPAVAWLWGGHFVLLERAGAGFRVVDPPKTPQPMTLTRLAGGYSGFALVLGRGRMPRFPGSHGFPDLRLSQYSVSLGFVSSTAGLGATVTCWNKGTRDLHVTSVECNLPGSRASWIKAAIPAGETRVLTVSVPESLASPVRGAVFLLRSDDPVTPVVPFRIEWALRPQRVTVHPKALAFVEVPKGSAKCAQVFVPSSSDERSPNYSDRPLRVLGVRCAGQWLAGRVSQMPDSERPYHVVDVTLKPDTPAGFHRGSVTIVTSHDVVPEVTLPVTAIVVGAVRVTPAVAVLGLARVGQRLEQYVTITVGGEDPVEVTAVNSLPHVDAVLVRGGPRRYSLRIVLRPSAPPGLIQDSLVLRTDSVQQPTVEVPVLALVETPQEGPQ